MESAQPRMNTDEHRVHQHRSFGCRTLLVTTRFAQRAPSARRRPVKKWLLAPFRRLARRASRRATRSRKQTAGASGAACFRDRVTLRAPADGRRRRDGSRQPSRRSLRLCFLRVRSSSPRTMKRPTAKSPSQSSRLICQSRTRLPRSYVRNGSGFLFQKELREKKSALDLSGV